MPGQQRLSIMVNLHQPTGTSLVEQAIGDPKPDRGRSFQHLCSMWFDSPMGDEQGRQRLLILSY
jgi:hypothetical protein